jgi:hypothetical protein
MWEEMKQVYGNKVIIAGKSNGSIKMKKGTEIAIVVVSW